MDWYCGGAPVEVPQVPPFNEPFVDAFMEDTPRDSKSPQSPRPRANAVLEEPMPHRYESIVTNIPDTYHLPCAEIVASILTTAVIVFCLIMLTSTDLCEGCSYTTLLAAVGGFWIGVLIRSTSTEM